MIQNEIGPLTALTFTNKPSHNMKHVNMITCKYIRFTNKP